jgi:hypothetical protein
MNKMPEEEHELSGRIYGDGTLRQSTLHLRAMRPAVRLASLYGRPRRSYRYAES